MRGGDGDTPTPPATEVSEESSGTEVEKEEEPVTTTPAIEGSEEASSDKSGTADTAESSGKEIEGEDVEKEEPVPTTKVS